MLLTYIFISIFDYVVNYAALCKMLVKSQVYRSQEKLSSNAYCQRFFGLLISLLITPYVLYPLHRQKSINGINHIVIIAISL